MIVDYSKKPRTVVFNVHGNIVHIGDRWLVTSGPAMRGFQILRVYDQSRLYCPALPAFYREFICRVFLHAFDNVVFANTELVFSHNLQDDARAMNLLKTGDETVQKDHVRFYKNRHVVKRSSHVDVVTAGRMASVQLPEVFRDVYFGEPQSGGPWLDVAMSDAYVVLTRKTADGVSVFVYETATDRGVAYSCAILDTVCRHQLVVTSDYLYSSNIRKTLRVNLKTGEYAVAVRDVMSSVLGRVPDALEIVGFDPTAGKNYTFNIETGVVHQLAVPKFTNELVFVDPERAVRGRSVIHFLTLPEFV